jgi:ABC-type glycerol-3-phosphate transport system substrate-binding protein
MFFGGAWFDETGRFVPDTSENIDAYQWICSLHSEAEAVGLDEPVNPVFSRAPAPFESGDVVAIFEGDFIVRQLIERPAMMWRPAPFPSSDGTPSALILADVVAVAANAQCPEGAREFLRFVTEPSHRSPGTRPGQVRAGEGVVSGLRGSAPQSTTHGVAPHP